MKTKTIEQVETFNAAPEEVYQLIMNAEKHAAFTGSEVIMSTAINGTFSAFDGYCHGYNIELIKGEKIVQAWHFAEEGWPENHYSICTFLFEPLGDKTKLTFIQTDVPELQAASISEGWKQFYWEPMEEYLTSNGY